MPFSWKKYCSINRQAFIMERELNEICGVCEWFRCSCEIPESKKILFDVRSYHLSNVPHRVYHGTGWFQCVCRCTTIAGFRRPNKNDCSCRCYVCATYPAQIHSFCGKKDIIYFSVCECDNEQRECLCTCDVCEETKNAATVKPALRKE
jgi:hypothetical protein